MDLPHGSSLSFWLSSMAMAWVNLIVQMVVPEKKIILSSGAEIITSLTMAMTLRSLQELAPGLAYLQGYVQWHISNSIMDTMREQGWTYLETLVLCCIAHVCLRAGSLFWVINSKISPFVLIMDVFTLVVVNCSVQIVMEYITATQLSSGIVPVLIVAVVLVRTAIKIRSQFANNMQTSS